MIGHAIAAEAETWIDTPFKWQGRCKGAGADCKGLVAGVAAECGRAEAGAVEALTGDYGPVVDPSRLKAGMARLFDRVTDRQPGDVLLCRLGGKAQHLAICAPKDGKPNRVIEAMPHLRVRPAHWPAHRVDSIWRWREAHAA